MTSHYTRSKAHRSGDVKPDDVVPVSATHPVSDTTPVRSNVAAAGEPGSMATEPAGPGSTPPSPSPEGNFPFGGGPGTPGSAVLLQWGFPFSLIYPSGLAGPIELDTQARG